MDEDAPAGTAASAAASASDAAAWSGASAAASSSSASGLMRRFVLNLPPGYHFVPTNAELVLHYLRPRLANQRLPLPIFFDEHILRYHPDRLVEKCREYGDDRWFFFTRRERKHEGGSRPNRATPDNGHWNATGCPKRIRGGGGELVGRMRTLVFYEAPRGKKKKKSRQDEAEAAGLPPMMPQAEEGEASKGFKTEWTMYEYESLSSEEEFLATGVDGKVISSLTHPLLIWLSCVFALHICRTQFFDGGPLSGYYRDRPSSQRDLNLMSDCQLPPPYSTTYYTIHISYDV
ncbi:unnamed protein product [Urochloa humidicola]